MKQASTQRAASALKRPGEVTIAIPFDAASDLKKMNRITESLLGRLGCAGCHSGFDIRFVLERDFRVNPATLEIEALGVRGL